VSAKIVGLVVEDEKAMRRFLVTALESHGFGVVEAGTCKEALAQFTSHRPDFVVLDLGLPDGDGLDVTRQLRTFSRVPVLVLSARGREQDKVLVLDAGADDYVTKPFGTEELLARIRVALRHAAGRGEESPTIVLGDLVIDLERRVVTLAGAEVHLTPIEYKILALLARHVGKVVTHTQLLSEIWGPRATQHTHYLRVHMAQLRRKIEVTPARPRYLLTEPGVGYRLREQAPKT
jgi:two-component system KDP operon response regulator KdpE